MTYIPVIGIYKITNKINGKFYIGSSKSINQRWAIHKNKLNKKMHHCRYLQNAWHKYGGENFIFEILELTSLDDLLIREQYYLDTLRPFDHKIGYNILNIAGGGDTYSNHPEKEKLIKNLRTKCTNWWHSLTVEEKSIIADKISLATKGRKFTDIHRKRKSEAQLGAKNHQFGRIYSQEERLKISLATKGINKCQIMQKVSINGIIYTSIAEASRILNIARGKLRGRLDSTTTRYKEYKYVD